MFPNAERNVLEAMSRAVNSRRDQRRRKIVSWSRNPSSLNPSPHENENPSPGAVYAPAADPHQQPALATIMPQGIGWLSITILVILTMACSVIGLSTAELVLQKQFLGNTETFNRTLAAVRDCLDLRSTGSLAHWISNVFLISAAAVAWSIRGMRQHRRDDYKGRFRAWGWFACLLFMTSLSSNVPIGTVFATFIIDCTGISFGPEGFGWWLVTCTFSIASIALWAFLPLQRRVGVGIWFTSSVILWLTSAACTWILAARQAGDQILITGSAAWVLTTAMILITMLTAAQTVIREVRGEGAHTSHNSHTISGSSYQVSNENVDDEATFVETAEEKTEFIDGSEPIKPRSRRLTKAEKKRMKRRARLQKAG